MGWFSAKVPNTISDKKYRQLQERARRAERKTFLSKKAAERRKASSKQMRKSIWS